MISHYAQQTTPQILFLAEQTNTVDFSLKWTLDPLHVFFSTKFPRLRPPRPAYTYLALDSHHKSTFLLDFDKRMTMLWLAILNFETNFSYRLSQWRTALSGAHAPTGNDLYMWIISVVACHHPLTFPKGCGTIVVIMMIMTMWWQTDRSTAVDAAAPSVAVGIEFTKRTKSADNESRTEWHHQSQTGSARKYSDSF